MGGGMNMPRCSYEGQRVSLFLHSGFRGFNSGLQSRKQTHLLRLLPKLAQGNNPQRTRPELATFAGAGQRQ